MQLSQFSAAPAAVHDRQAPDKGTHPLLPPGQLAVGLPARPLLHHVAVPLRPGLFGGEIWGHGLFVRMTSPCAKFPHMTCHIVRSPRRPISSAFQRACNGAARVPGTGCGRLWGAIRAWESWRPRCANDIPRPTTTTMKTTMTTTNACGPGGPGRGSPTN